MQAPTTGDPRQSSTSLRWARRWVIVTRIGCIVTRVASARLFGYQHVGIPNGKFFCWGSRPTRGPIANGFALQWNIGFRNLYYNVIWMNVV